MGAGAVKGQAVNSEGQGQMSSPLSMLSSPIMACERCSVEFTIFKRKKICYDCRRHHCSTCLPKEPERPSSQRRCHKCRLLSSGNFTRHELMELKVKDLRLFLGRKNVATQNCTEKNDLVELALRYSNSSQHFREQEERRRHVQELQERQRQECPPEPCEPPQSNPSTVEHSSLPSEGTSSIDPETDEERKTRLQQRQQREMMETEARLGDELGDEIIDPRPPKERANIDHVSDVGDIEELTVKQLKEILATNFVDYKGCCEKWELVERVKRLWHDNMNHKGKEETMGEEDLCKICMDKPINCVLLECGHMVTCTTCGKRLAECPFCRQIIIRVVHIFKV